MIVAVRKGNLLESDAQTLVNTVNTVGVMGKGIALEFKRRYPDMFADYERRCAAGGVRLGEPYLYETLLKWIVNFPTKSHWRAVSRLSDIEVGLRYLAARAVEWGIESLAVPPLGCGHGQLEWAVVGPTIYRHLRDLPMPVELYAPLDVPDEQATIEFLEHGVCAPAREGTFVEPAWLAFPAIVAKLAAEPYTVPIGRTGFQELAYLATVAGVPTSLEFEAGSSGPYSAGLTQVLTRLVNNGLLDEERVGRMLQLRPGPTSADAIGRTDLSEYAPAIARVTDLLARLERPGMELATTVHFSAVGLARCLGREPTEAEVLQRVLAWKARHRPPYDAPTVAAAIRNLAALGWLEVARSDDLPVDDDVLTVA